ncbi:hypothetical protein ADICEAN_03545 [Cesiribacter andamanensis AMV16]|uniref:Uncharacterized protein n=1 Tax=Cesiribacter andamanensis AMV16 TaxID=1279009 RepID=M7N1Z8_9BACT|nr:hypothetical protein ADICEAN_03545 [Cesiribacter andamanensis AMV16]
MELSSAPMLDPTRPAQIRPVISGPRERTMAMDTSEGSQLSAPNSSSEGRLWRVNTMPAISPVKPTSAKVRTPIWYDCRSTSRVS